MNRQTKPPRPRTGHLAFVGRQRLLEECRRDVSAGQGLWLTGEHGIGKTALSRRIDPEAIYVPHPTPIKEAMTALLMECWRRGWWEREGDEAEVERAVARIPYKLQAGAAIAALQDRHAVIVLDEFETATTTTVRIARRLAEVATLVVCSTGARPTQAPFLFQLKRVDVPRLTESEAKTLTFRLLDDHRDKIPPAEIEGLMRHLVEEAQGLPSVLHQLVQRAAAKGSLALRTVRQEQLSGHRTVDMTPGLVIALALLVGLRVLFRGGSDHDLTLLLGAAGILFMVLRMYAGRLSAKQRR